MNLEYQLRKYLFLVFVIVAGLGHLFLPKGGFGVDLSIFPHEAKIASDDQIISYKKAGIQSNASDSISYLVCSIDDDLEGTNAYGIYDPTDLAVTVNNLVRLDIKHLFLGTHLHWPDLPAIENNTLNSQLELLDSCILSTPLRRTVNDVEIPSYLLESSLPITEIKGDTRLLPRVNNLSLAPTMKIPVNCKVGFSQLESEPASDDIALLAVWGDRVIVSSLLLERLHQLDIGVKDLNIIVNDSISLGNVGNVIPIDEYGYFDPSESVKPKEADIISAEITAVEMSPVQTRNALLTASGIKAASFRAIESPVVQLKQLAFTPSYIDRVKYARVQWWITVLIIFFLALLLVIGVRKSAVSFVLWAFLLVAGVYFGGARLVSESSYYSPILYLCLALVVSMVLYPFINRYVLKKAKRDGVKGEILDDPSECFTEDISGKSEISEPQ